MQKWMLRIIVVIFTWSSKVTNCHGSNSNSKNITVIQFDTVRLDCYSGYDESADWYFHSRFGDTDPIYSSGYLQPQQELKYSITPGSGFYNLTVFNVSFEDIGRYECREGWGVGGRPRHNFEVDVTDFDECSEWDICGLNANCTNTQGSFTCTCHNGFIRIEFECEDVNECNSTPCDVDANCENLPGSYLCTCDQIDQIYLRFTNSCTVTQEVHVPMGDSMQLRCQTFPNAPITWLFMATNVSREVHLYRNKQIVDTSRNISKHLMKPEDGDYSLTLNEVKLTDTGYYLCVNENDRKNRGYSVIVSATVTETSHLSDASYDDKQRYWVIAGMCLGSVAVLLCLIGITIYIEYRNKRPKVIATYKSRKGAVTGLTFYGNELFVIRLCKREGIIEVHDATTHTYRFKRIIKVRELNGYDVRGLTSCDKYKCLYVSGWLKTKSNKGYIFRRDMSGSKAVSHWSVDAGVNADSSHPRGLSVNFNHNLLVACVQLDRVIEYTTYGVVLRRIHLQADVVYPRHAIQLNEDKILVCHGNSNDTLHRVSEVDADGRVLNGFGGAPGPENEQLYVPESLAIVNANEKKFIFVADRDNNRILVLCLRDGCSFERSNDLRFEGEDVIGPYSLCFDEQRSLLLVGEWNGNNSRIILLKVEGLTI